MASPTRQAQHLAEIARRYPLAWRQMESFRQDKGSPSLGDWPDWCWLPMAAAYAVASGGGRMPPDRTVDVGRIAALAAWRLGQGVYRFDPALYGPVADTELSRDIPHQVLYRLPEWCVYIETPGLESESTGLQVHGAYVHLECDIGRQGRAELRLVLDTDDLLIPIPLHLGPWPLVEAFGRAMDQAKSTAAVYGQTVSRSDGVAAATVELARPIVNLALYLCSQGADIGTPGQVPPSRAQARKVKAGLRWFAAERPAVWDVGVRIGAALRRAYQQQQTAGDSGAPTGATVRPHVRRAHYHTILSGPRLRDDGSAIPPDQRRADVRWMPPIPVNVDDLDSMPVVIRPVR